MDEREDKWSASNAADREKLDDGFAGLGTLSTDSLEAPGTPPKWEERPRGFARMFAAFALGVLASVVVAVTVLGLHGHSKPGPAQAEGPVSSLAGDSSGTNSNVSSLNTIVVDVHGDVRHPGVYTLPANARVEDAVAAAGGYRHATDANDVNAAATLNDGTEVVIPGPTKAPDAAGATGPQGAANESTSPGTGSTRIDLNTADVSTLETLPGIGLTRAQAIVSYRSQHGPFADVSAITQVSGIGPGILSKIAPYLFVH